MDSASEILALASSICTLSSGSYNTMASSTAGGTYNHYPSIIRTNNNLIYPDASYSAGSGTYTFNVCSCSVTTNCNTNCDCSSINKVAATNAPTKAPTNAPTKAPTNAPTDAPTNGPASQKVDNDNDDDSSDLSDAKIAAIATGSGLFLVSAIGGAVYYFSSSSTAKATATATESTSNTVDNGESDKKQTIIDLSNTKTPGV